MLALLLSAAWAAATVTLEADTNELQVGQVSTLTLSVVGAAPVDVPDIRSPTGLEVTFSHSAQRNFQVNFQVVRMIRYTYRVTALSEGQYRVGPVAVELADGSVTSNPVTVAVVPRPVAGDAPLVASAEFLDEEAWEGEVVLYRYRLSSRARILRSQWTLPPFDGLLAPRDGNRPRREYRLEDPSGVVGIDETYIPLVVTGSGDLSQPPAVVRVDVPIPDGRPDAFTDPFGVFTRAETEVLATGPAPLIAKPLPKPPPTFTKLVGDFAFTAEFDRAKVAVGESATLTVTARGDGTLEGFRLPAAPEVEGARIYDGSPSVEATVANETYMASGTYQRTIVPLAVGQLVVPPIEIVAFSPTEGRYVTHRVEVPPVAVVAGREGAGTVESFGPDGAAPVEVPKPQDIYDVRASGAARRTAVGPALPLLLAAGAAPGLAVVAGRLLTLFARRARRTARVRPPTVAERLARLPEVRDARLAELGLLLRERALAPELVLELERARFSGSGDAASLEERARAALGSR